MLLTSCGAMERPSGRLGDACVRRAIGSLLIVAGSSLVLPALAQTTVAPSEVAPSERAKRDADKVFHWILIQGDRTRKAPAAKDAAKEPKEERATATRPVKAPTPDLVPRPKADAATAGPAAIDPKPAAKQPEAVAPSVRPAAVVDAPKPDPARLARTEPAPQTLAPAIELPDDAPRGLVAIAQPAPQFPVNVMRTLRRGTVQVQFSVLTDGSVANLEVLKTTSARLNAAALEAVGQWRFQPVARVQTGAVEVGFDLD